VATTIVSSSMLSQIAKRHGVQYRETLTGFKWLARNALALSQYRHVLSYEEALGYSVGTLVRDKDGISAALVFADLAASLRSRGSSIGERLVELEADYGRFDTSQWSLRFEGPEALTEMAALMQRLRADLPDAVAGLPVTEVRDLSSHEPPADVVILALGDSGRITVRPSGTEPKCKVYFEVVSHGGAEPVTIEALRHAMAAVLGVPA
jgi:phosphomannomutase